MSADELAADVVRSPHLEAFPEGEAPTLASRITQLEDWLKKSGDAHYETKLELAALQKTNAMLADNWTNTERLLAAEKALRERTRSALAETSTDEENRLRAQLAAQTEERQRAERERDMLRLLKDMDALEVSTLATYLRNGDIPETIERARLALVRRMLSAESRLHAVEGALALAVAWIEQEEGRTVAEVVEIEDRFRAREGNKPAFNQQFVAMCRAVHALGKERRMDTLNAETIERCAKACIDMPQPDGTTYTYWPCVNAIRALSPHPTGQEGNVAGRDAGRKDDVG